jgi:hypothetical protein
MELTVDSAAGESVCNPTHGPLRYIPLKESWGSKNRVQYRSATGENVPNLGEKKVRIKTEEGITADLTIQACNVTKPLLSVGKINEQGNRVVFETSGKSYIENVSSGKKIWLKKVRGVFVATVKVWVPFQRQHSA